MIKVKSNWYLTISKVLQYQGVRKEVAEVAMVAELVMSKIQEMNDGANSSCMFCGVCFLHYPLILLFFFKIFFTHLFRKLISLCHSFHSKVLILSKIDSFAKSILYRLYKYFRNNSCFYFFGGTR